MRQAMQLARFSRLLFTVGFLFVMVIGFTGLLEAAGNELPYHVTGTMDRGEQLEIQLEIKKSGSYNEDAYLVVQLMKGHAPVLINAIPLDETMNLSQVFNVSGTSYSVKVFVVNKFEADEEIPEVLAEPLWLQ